MGLLPMNLDILPPSVSIRDERERAIFRGRRKSQTDMASNLAVAEDNGEKIGRTERNVEIARKMLSPGEPADKIMLITDLTWHKIEILHTASEKN